MEHNEYDDWITSRRFWIDTLERIIRTTAQVAVAVFGFSPAADAAAGVPVDITAGWHDKLVVIVATAIMTFVTCLAGRATGDPSTASLTSGTDDEPRT